MSDSQLHIDLSLHWDVEKTQISGALLAAKALSCDGSGGITLTSNCPATLSCILHQTNSSISSFQLLWKKNRDALSEAPAELLKSLHTLVCLGVQAGWGGLLTEAQDSNSPSGTG